MNFCIIINDFLAVNKLKRSNRRSMSENQLMTWRRLRNQVEQTLRKRPSYPGTDQREHLRVPVTVSVNYKNGNECEECYPPEMGEGGLSICTQDPLPVGSMLDMKVALAHRFLSFSVKGEVVWNRLDDDPTRLGMGIKFVNLVDEQKSVINCVIDEYVLGRFLEL